jgi:hypothetical protein
MSRFVYILAEGVHDVAFLGRLLKLGFGASRVRTMEALDEGRRAWMSSFKWPSTRGDATNIDRLAVPAPVFHRLAAGTLVALRNAEGIDRMFAMLERDLESFDRDRNGPDTIGVVRDSDKEPPEQQFQEIAVKLQDLKLAVPQGFGHVAGSAPRIGVFALPEPGVAGTLEDVLLSLGEVAYPELFMAARSYVEQFRNQAELGGSDWKELRAPAGPKKATIGAMTAMLKPGKSMQTSLDDNGWVSEATKAAPALQPCLSFLHALLALTPVAAPDIAP